MKTTLTRLTENFKLYPHSILPKVKTEGTEFVLEELGIDYEKTVKGETYKYEFELNLSNATKILKALPTKIKGLKSTENLSKLRSYLEVIIKEKQEALKKTLVLGTRETVETELERLYEQDELIKSTGLTLSEIIRLAQKTKEADTVSYSVSGNRIDIKGEIENIKFYGGTTTITLKKTEEEK